MNFVRKTNGGRFFERGEGEKWPERSSVCRPAKEPQLRRKKRRAAVEVSGRIRREEEDR